MSSARLLPVLALALGAAVASGCGKSSDAAPAPVTTTPPASMSQIPGHDTVPQDNSPKDSPRLLPAESFVRSYLTIFGGLSPLDAQKALKGSDGALFDSWNDYLSSLGFPDYRIDLPRGTQTNALMLATFERVGIALCDRAAQNDLAKGASPDARVVFAFDPADGLDQAGFAQRFDVLHRTFLGYPAALAPTDRTTRFFQLYSDTLTHHTKDKVKSQLTPDQAAWAVVCQGLIRHPEFHLY